MAQATLATSCIALETSDHLKSPQCSSSDQGKPSRIGQIDMLSALPTQKLVQARTFPPCLRILVDACKPPLQQTKAGAIQPFIQRTHSIADRHSNTFRCADMDRLVRHMHEKHTRENLKRPLPPPMPSSSCIPLSVQKRPHYPHVSILLL